MNANLTSELLLAAVLVGIAGAVIAARDLPPVTAILVATTKTIIPLAYFGYFFDGTWTFLDDVTYQLQGEEMLRLGYGPLTALLDEGGRSKLFELSEGRHVLYGWWNLLAQNLFGQHYHAAVLLNVLLTFATGFIFARTLAQLDFSSNYRRGALIVFLLHWDVLVWSSVVNLKDILIMSLIAASLHSMSLLRTSLRLRYLVALGLPLFLLTWLRFYMPLFLLGAFMLWMLLETRHYRKYIYAALVVAATFLLPLDWSSLAYVRPAETFFGLVRVLLTPQPWSIESEYGFLLLPSLLHWILFIPMLMGGALLWMASGGNRLALIFIALTVLFYAAVPELQGPRHRVQFTFITAWMQFHFFWELSKLAIRRDPSLGVAA